MKPQNRKVLRNYFKNGKLLTEEQFSDLIESSWNKIDDGINKNDTEGLQLNPGGTSQNIISFYKNTLEGSPDWQLAINLRQSKGLGFTQPGKEEPMPNGTLFYRD
jgi:hypothetical protein